MKELKLKPCPFCGGKAEFRLFSIRSKNSITVRCKSCNAVCEHVEESLNYCAKQVAADKWNSRSPWKKLADEYPEEGLIVLVYNHINNTVYSGALYDDEFELEDSTDEFRHFAISNVEYWMPMPEPPGGV